MTIAILILVAGMLDLTGHAIACDLRDRRAVASRIERRLRRR